MIKSVTILVRVVGLILLFCGAEAVCQVENGEIKGADADMGAEKPSIDITIEGTLVDSTRQPINEGLVMLQGNPQLNALTCSDGRFLIQGQAWEIPDTLLASSAGKQVAQVKIDNPQVKGLSITLQPQDPAYTKIEMGMALKIGWFGPYKGYRGRPLTPTQKECIQACDDFLNNKGNAIIDKMLAGTALSDEEKPYEYILASQIGCRLPPDHTKDFPANDARPEVQYCARIKNEFYRVSLKGIRRQRLTESDVHALRLMAAMWRGTGFDATGDGYYRGMGVRFSNTEPGKPLPFDVPLLRSSPLLSSPVWSNYTSLSATAHLRLEGIWPYLDSYWKWRIHGENTLVVSPPEEWKQHYWQDWYQVTSLNELVKKADGKPVYLYSANFTDTTHPGFCTRQNDYLRWAFRGFADVYLLSQTGGTAWSDVWEDEWKFYGPNPKSDPLAGLDCPRWEDDNYTPLRHARTDKICTMEPACLFASGDILLDLPRFSSYLNNQPFLVFQLILDRNGKVAVPFCGHDPNGSGYSAVDGRYFLDADGYDYQSYIRQGGQSYELALLHEQMLRVLVENDGRMGPETFDKILMQYPKTFTAKDDLFVVKSVDKENSLIHAGWIDPGGVKARLKGFGEPNPRLDGEPKGDFLLKVSPDTRYLVRCKDGKPVMMSQSRAPTWDSIPGAEFRQGGLDDFKPGDRFFVTIRLPEPLSDVKMSSLIAGTDKGRNTRVAFDMGKYDGKELSVERVMNYLHCEVYNGENANYMPLYGRITQKANDVITVQINQDEVKEMHGYQFWKEEEAKGRLASEEPALFWPTVKRWGDGTDEDRTYRFKVDGATDVYRNGLVAESNDLMVGDYVFVEYETWWETQKMQKGIIYPERLQASAPMNNHTEKAAE